ncbi:MAG TPA: type IIL restriction-modification enzyme MmeI [Polyangiaceae bacterium]|nr:type IIL restriction-modification enzyme MmeI [Polyangiaceae bacterium]
MSRCRRGINAFGGNMPFLGGRRIATLNGETYAAWLTQRYGGSGDTDYVGYFFHRAAELMAPEGMIGFIATSALAEGDNRRTVLFPLVHAHPPFEIVQAETDQPWPGNAQVLISTVFLQRGLDADVLPRKRLNGRSVQAINSRLRGGDEWPDPEPLSENVGYSLVGCFLRGDGFILSPAEAEAFLAAHPEESAVVRPYVVGDDLNNSVDQRAQRFVINFEDKTLEEAQRFPHALAILEEQVRPQRERLKVTGTDAEHRRLWWRFANTRRDLREHAAKVPRMLATARVSKHTMFSFIPPSWTPSEQVVVFPLPNWTAFAVLQSRVHAAWVALNATHMGEGLRYSASECFATFPFPNSDPTATLPELESLGRSLYERRADVLASTQGGLTNLYNDLKDSVVADADVAGLRATHEQLDRAVIAAYGWHDVVVPAYASHADASQALEDDLIARLVALNVARATTSAVPNAAPTVAVPSAGPALAKTKLPRKGVASATVPPTRQRRKASDK